MNELSGSDQRLVYMLTRQYGADDARARMIALLYAFGMPLEGHDRPTCTRGEMDALMLLTERIVGAIPIAQPPKEPDWSYLAACLRRCGYAVGLELDEALEALAR